MANIQITDLKPNSSEIFSELEPLSKQMDEIVGGGFWGKVIGSTIGKYTGYLVNYITGSDHYDESLADLGGKIGDVVGDYVSDTYA